MESRYGKYTDASLAKLFSACQYYKRLKGVGVIVGVVVGVYHKIVGR
jgi:hypothetical protein